jgi:hypothetical protein
MQPWRKGEKKNAEEGSGDRISNLLSTTLECKGAWPSAGVGKDASAGSDLPPQRRGKALLMHELHWMEAFRREKNCIYPAELI